MASSCPVRRCATSGIFSMPRHSFAITKSVLLPGLPSMQAKPPRSRLMVSSTSPPSRTRTQRLGNVCIPHGVVHVYADSIWYAVTQVGPYPPVLQASVCGNVESRKAFAMGFGNDQRRIVRSNGYPIWEREAIGDLTD